MGKYYYNDQRLSAKDRKRQIARALADLEKSGAKSEFSTYDIARQMGMTPSKRMRELLESLAHDGVINSRGEVHRWVAGVAVVKQMYSTVADLEPEWPKLKINGKDLFSITEGKQ